MIKKMTNKVRKYIYKLKRALGWTNQLLRTPLKYLTWPKRIFKLVLIAVGFLVAVVVILNIIVGIAALVAVMGFIFSFGGAIEHGTNEAIGRNRHR